MLYSFHRRTESEIYFEENFHTLEIVVGNVLFFTNIKKTKETVIFLILALLVPKMLNYP